MRNSDLQSIIGDWRYDPSAINARWVLGLDGRPKVQLRLDLGVLQMEVTNRPDGACPRGFDSLLDYFLYIEENAKNKGQPFRLSTADYTELQQEAAQYYYRYIALYALRDFDHVIADTEHNITLINLVWRYAEDKDTSWQMVQFYPYVRMMDARARAERAMDKKAYDEAIQALEEGICEIRQFWIQCDDPDAEFQCREIELLSELLVEIRGMLPKSDTDRLREELARAIELENYERAAILRDQLNAIPCPAHHGA